MVQGVSRHSSKETGMFGGSRKQAHVCTASPRCCLRKESRESSPLWSWSPEAVGGGGAQGEVTDASGFQEAGRQPSRTPGSAQGWTLRGRVGSLQEAGTQMAAPLKDSISVPCRASVTAVSNNGLVAAQARGEDTWLHKSWCT